MEKTIPFHFFTLYTKSRILVEMVSPTILSLSLYLLINVRCILSFTSPITSSSSAFGINNKRHFSTTISQASNTNNELSAREEAEALLEKARKLRESLASESPSSKIKNSSNAKDEEKDETTNEYTENDDNNNPNIESYRLYVNIGREEGTWMDPRWGASGTRVEFTLDMAFLSTAATNEEKEKMVKDNFGGKSSMVRQMTCLSNKGARLRRGFDNMTCYGGGYRLDSDKQSVVVRFFVDVEGLGGTNDSSYGDITIPKGCLYFSIPCFGGSVKNLSMKEGPITVRQMGWHTGWRREESRIVGTFKAIPLEKAKQKDGF